MNDQQCHTHPKIKDAPKRRRESSHSRALGASKSKAHDSITSNPHQSSPMTPSVTSTPLYQRKSALGSPVDGLGTMIWVPLWDDSLFLYLCHPFISSYSRVCVCMIWFDVRFWKTSFYFSFLLLPFPEYNTILFIWSCFLFPWQKQRGESWRGTGRKRQWDFHIPVCSYMGNSSEAQGGIPCIFLHLSLQFIHFHLWSFGARWLGRGSVGRWDGMGKERDEKQQAWKKDELGTWDRSAGRRVLWFYEKGMELKKIQWGQVDMAMAMAMAGKGAKRRGKILIGFGTGFTSFFFF